MQEEREGQKVRSAKVPPAVKQKIAELKRRYRSFEVKKISQLLRRMFFLKASRQTVRRTLHHQSLISKGKTKVKRSPPKPRFFEHSTANQIWQSDILTSKELARLRAELILEVRSGQISATDAAKRLGVSRKTYYKWERRALKGMVKALDNRGRGRPSAAVDPETQALNKKKGGV
jgi:transposase